MSNEKLIEAELVGLLESANYIASNAIPVFPCGDIPEGTKAFARVEVEPIDQDERHVGTKHYNCVINLIAAAEIQHDKDGDKRSAIQADCFAVAKALTPLGLTGATGLQIDGIIQDGGSRSTHDFGPQYSVVSVRRRLFMTLD